MLKLEVANFRGIRQLNLPVAGVCALVGPNGAGKSTILSILEFMRTTLERGLPFAVDYSGGVNKLKNTSAKSDDLISIRLGIGKIDWRIMFNTVASGVPLPAGETVHLGGKIVARQLPSTSTMEVLSQQIPTDLQSSALARAASLAPPVVAEAAADLAVLRNMRHYQNYHIWTLRKEGSQLGGDTWFHPTGRNAFTVLHNWAAGLKLHRERWEWVRAALRHCFPDTFDDLDFPIAGQTVAAQFYAPGSHDPMPMMLAPNGLIAALISLGAVASTPDNGVVAIDEIENGLHPYAINSLLDAIRKRSALRNLTVLLATHSPVVLATFNSDKSRILVVKGSANNAVLPLTELQDPEWLNNFNAGELFAHYEFGNPAP